MLLVLHPSITTHALPCENSDSGSDDGSESDSGSGTDCPPPDTTSTTQVIDTVNPTVAPIRSPTTAPAVNPASSVPQPTTTSRPATTSTASTTSFAPASTTEPPIVHELQLTVPGDFNSFSSQEIAEIENAGEAEMIARGSPPIYRTTASAGSILLTFEFLASQTNTSDIETLGSSLQSQPLTIIANNQTFVSTNVVVVIRTLYPTVSPTLAPTSKPLDSTDDSLSDGAIVGIVIGVLVAVVVIGVVIQTMTKQEEKKPEYSSPTIDAIQRGSIAKLNQGYSTVSLTLKDKDTVRITSI